MRALIGIGHALSTAAAQLWKGQLRVGGGSPLVVTVLAGERFTRALLNLAARGLRTLQRLGRHQFVAVYVRIITINRDGLTSLRPAVTVYPSDGA